MMVLLAGTAVALALSLAIPLLRLYTRRRVEQPMAAAAVATLFAALVWETSAAVGLMPSWKHAVEIDPFSAFLAGAAALSALLVIAASEKEVGEWPTAPAAYSLFVLGLVGVIYTVFASSIVMLIAGWSLASVVSYVLAGVNRSPSSAEAAVKYAVTGGLGSILLLVAAAVLLTGLGTDLVLTATPEYAAAVAAAALLLAAVGYKVGIVPYHGWLPDVYTGAHPLVTTYLSTVVKVVGIAVLSKFLIRSALGAVDEAVAMLAALSIVTMVYGNLTALVQRNVQRMMAYSSIAHVGYILVGLAALSPGGLAAVGLHTLAYVLGKGAAFLTLAYVLRKLGGVTLDDIAGLGRRMPATALMLTISLLSLAGIPPFLGFWGKLYLFLSVAGTMPWLALIAAVNSGISVAYYAIVIKQVYFVEGEGSVVEEKGDPELPSIGVMTLLTVLLGLGPSPLIYEALKTFAAALL